MLLLFAILVCICLSDFLLRCCPFSRSPFMSYSRNLGLVESETMQCIDDLHRRDLFYKMTSVMLI